MGGRVAAGAGGSPVPPSAGSGEPVDGGDEIAECMRRTTRLSQTFASDACSACLCGLDPAATAQCDMDCWSLIQCVLHFGCVEGDVACAVEHCGNGTCEFEHCRGGEFDRFMNAGALAQKVPVRDCLEQCFPPPDTGVDAQTCEPLRAERASAVVGESIALHFDERVGPGEFALAVTPWSIVGSLHHDDEQPAFRCDAPGKAVIELVSDRCSNGLLTVEVECTARPDAQCCPIEALPQGGSDACSELGGSPPCLRGCACLREGGVHYTELDAQGCLQWVLRPALDSPDHLVCLDEAGQPAPDPRR